MTTTEILYAVGVVLGVGLWNGRLHQRVNGHDKQLEHLEEVPAQLAALDERTKLILYELRNQKNDKKAESK